MIAELTGEMLQEVPGLQQSWFVCFGYDKGKTRTVVSDWTKSAGARLTGSNYNKLTSKLGPVISDFLKDQKGRLSKQTEVTKALHRRLESERTKAGEAEAKMGKVLRAEEDKLSELEVQLEKAKDSLAVSRRYQVFLKDHFVREWTGLVDRSRHPGGSDSLLSDFCQLCEMAVTLKQVVDMSVIDQGVSDGQQK